MDLRTLFDLAEHGPDTFVGRGPLYPWGGLYGGQIVAQALRAASSTIDPDLEPHSLRAYFIRRGDHDEPVRYEVDRIRNGRSFATRRVVARQAIGAILNLEASYQRREAASDVPTVHPPDVPAPAALGSTSWSPSFERRFVPDGVLDDAGRTGTGRVAAWMRVNDRLPQDELLHRCWLAYLSDDLPFDSVSALLARHGRERVGLGELAFLGPAEVRADADPGRATLEQELESRQSSSDTCVVGDSAVLERNVQVGTDKHHLARNVGLAYRPGLLQSSFPMRSTRRHEYPHSLSYQPNTLTMLPFAIVNSLSKMHE